MKITAAVLDEPGGRFVLDEVELDAPRPDEVVVAVRAVGVCHTDMIFARGAYATPCVLGHEGAGVVVEVGSGVGDVAVGDHVLMSFESCGGCRKCLAGHPAFCASMAARNFGGRRIDGTTTLSRSGRPIHGSFFGQSSFGSHALVRERNLVKLPDDVPFAVAAPMACGIQTGAGTILNVLRPEIGESVAIFGAGAVGLSAALAARSLGAGPVVVVEPVPQRRSLALDLGVTHALDPSADLPGEMATVVRGGVDCAIDTSGRPEVMRAAFDALAPDGRLALVAAERFDAEVALPVTQVMSGKRLVGAIEGDSIPRLLIPRLIDLWRHGRLPIERLTTEFPLASINEAIDAAKSGAVVKPVLVP